MNINKITLTYVPINIEGLTNKLFVDSSISNLRFQGYIFNPFQNGTTTIAAGNKSYFYHVRINRPTTINGVSIYLLSGSDAVRCVWNLPWIC